MDVRALPLVAERVPRLAGMNAKLLPGGEHRQLFCGKKENVAAYILQTSINVRVERLEIRMVLNFTKRTRHFAMQVGKFTF